MCNVSVTLINYYQAWILSKYLPVNMTADGNCLFRSVSKCKYGTEDHHMHLWLLCVNEVSKNRTLYDKTSPDFCSQFATDALLVLPTFDHFVSELCGLGNYSDFFINFGFEFSVGQTHSVWPLQVKIGDEPPYSKLIAGCGVINCRKPIMILWTMCVFTGSPLT